MQSRQSNWLDFKAIVASFKNTIMYKYMCNRNEDRKRKRDKAFNMGRVDLDRFKVNFQYNSKLSQHLIEP